ncbi:MAG: Flp pilus assembly protein CpaB [Pelosinus sp.]|nr:Flp pilus assembly protein CpaB [Pelosinus sp.]
MAKLPSSKGIFILALVLSFVTAFMVYKFLGSAVSKQPVQEGQVVLVAKTAIEPKTKITPDMIQEVKIPGEYVQAGTISDKSKVIGAVARDKIAAGEHITERRLYLEGKSVGFTGVIPSGKRAITLAVNEVTGIAGFVKAGDFVDVVVVFDAGTVGDNTSGLLLENILVLAANKETENGVVETSAKDAPKEAVKMGTVTLALAPDAAAKLVLAEEKGKVHLALRPYLPGTEAGGSFIVTPKDLVGVQVSPVQNSSKAESGGSSAPKTETVAPVAREVKPQTSSGGIKVIRGTKADIVSVR